MKARSSLILYKPVAQCQLTMACIQYAVIIHSYATPCEQVKLVELENDRYNLCVRHLLAIVKNHKQHTHLQEPMKSSKPEIQIELKFYAAYIICPCI